MSKIKVDIPKHRRNSGEVKPYNELTQRRNPKSDAFLLWMTTFVLGGAVLVLGCLLVYWNSETVSNQVAGESTVVTPRENLEQARQHFIRGESRRALTAARVALALEQQKPSEPPLEKEIRHVLGLADMEQRDYVEAVENFAWLQQHGGGPDDLKRLSEARSKLRKLNVDAVEELEGAQRLSTRGVQEQAYAQAGRAVSSLRHNQGGNAQVQAGHLVMANISLRQGQLPAALQHLREARKLGALTQQQQALLEKLAGARTGKNSSLVSAQMPVTVPRLETSVAYPQGRPGRPAISGTTARPAPPVAEEVEGLPDTAGVSPPPRKAPHIELPKLQYPGGQNVSGSGLPGYQNNNRSSSLPGYNGAQTRTRDTLPGY
jgi:hypothetical protein